MRHSRESVLERVEAEFAELESAIAALTPEDWKRRVARPESKDPWTLKDSLAHITHWKADSARVLRRERRSPEAAALSKLTINASNHALYNQYRDLPLKDVLAWHRRVQDELVAALRHAPEQWISGRDRREHWPFDAADHSKEHRLQDLRPPATVKR